MTCSACKQDLDESHFCKDKHAKSGLSGRCRACYSLKAKDWYVNNKQRQYDLARTPHMRFNFAKKNAKKRDLTWSIEREKYLELIKLPCDYCFKTPDSNTTTGVGLDRLNNDVGYELANVVPCCGPCNVGRNANFTPEEWKVAITAILTLRSSKF